MAGSRRFDTQAATFDARAGLPPTAREQVARAVLDMAGPGSGLVLEIGAGTGEVGIHLAAMARRYVGIDLSRPMLDAFRARFGGRAGRPMLVQADCDRPWPVRAGSLRVVFASRAAHLLDVGHVVAELGRGCGPGACFLVGRVERTGLKKQLRREREDLATARGVRTRSGARRTQALLEALVESGAEPVPRATVATWPVTTTAEAVIAAWEDVPSIGGVPVAPATRDAVLAELRERAAASQGRLDRPDTSDEGYILEGVRLR